MRGLSIQSHFEHGGFNHKLMNRFSVSSVRFNTSSFHRQRSPRTFDSLFIYDVLKGVHLARLLAIIRRVLLSIEGVEVGEESLGSHFVNRHALSSNIGLHVSLIKLFMLCYPLFDRFSITSKNSLAVLDELVTTSVDSLAHNT